MGRTSRQTMSDDANYGRIRQHVRITPIYLAASKIIDRLAIFMGNSMLSRRRGIKW